MGKKKNNYLKHLRLNYKGINQVKLWISLMRQDMRVHVIKVFASQFC